MAPLMSSRAREKTSNFSSHSSQTRQLERAEDVYHGFCWSHETGEWLRRRALYRRGEGNPIGFIDCDTPEDAIFRLIDGSLVGADSLSTTAAAKRFANGHEVETFLEGLGAEAREEAEEALDRFARMGLLTWSEPVEYQVPASFQGLTPRRDERAKVIRQFSDLALLWQTSRLNTVSTSVDLNDNPILAVPAWIADAYEMLDGAQSLGDILAQLWAVHGTARISPERLLSVVARLGELGFLTAESRDQLSGIPITWPQSEWDFDVSVVQRSYVNTDVPMYVLMELTAKCNRECPYCYKLSHDPEEDMAEDDYLRDVVQKVIDANVPYVTLLGGEPMLRRNLLYEAIRRLSAANVFTKVITNGDFMTPAAAKTLSDAGLNKIELSLDGFVEETSDRFRGARSLTNVMHALDCLEGTAISDVGLSVTISNANYGEVIRDLSGFLDRFPHLNKIYFSRHFEGRHVNNMEETAGELTAAQIRYLSEKIETEWKPRFRSRPGFDMAVLDSGSCSCGRSLAVLTCEGAVKPCPFTHEHGTKLESDQAFRDLWHVIFRPLRVESKDTCWARKVRNLITLKVPDKKGEVANACSQ